MEQKISEYKFITEVQNYQFNCSNSFLFIFFVAFVDRAKYPRSIIWACCSIFTVLLLWRNRILCLKMWEKIHFFCIALTYFLKLNGEKIQMRMYEIPLLQDLKRLLYNQIIIGCTVLKNHFQTRITSNVKKSKLMHVKED